MSTAGVDFWTDGMANQIDMDLFFLRKGTECIFPTGYRSPNNLPINQEELDKVLLDWGTTADVSTAATVIPEPSALSVALIVTCLVYFLCRSSAPL